MTHKELLYVLALQHVPKIGDVTAKKLIQYCGSAEAIFKEKRQHLLKIDGVGTRTTKGLFHLEHMKAAESELEFIKESGITCLYFTDFLCVGRYVSYLRKSL